MIHKSEKKLSQLEIYEEKINYIEKRITEKPNNIEILKISLSRFKNILSEYKKININK